MANVLSEYVREYTHIFIKHEPLNHSPIDSPEAYRRQQTRPIHDIEIHLSTDPQLRPLPGVQRPPAQENSPRPASPEAECKLFLSRFIHKATRKLSRNPALPASLQSRFRKISDSSFPMLTIALINENTKIAWPQMGNDVQFAL